MRERLNEKFADSFTSREILRSTKLPQDGRNSLHDIVTRVEWTYFVNAQQPKPITKPAAQALPYSHNRCTEGDRHDQPSGLFQRVLVAWIAAAVIIFAISLYSWAAAVHRSRRL